MAVGKDVAEGERLLEVSLHDEKTTVTARTLEEKVTWRNLPHKKQLLLLALCRLSTPLSNACLLPYLYYLVKSILSDPEHPSAPQQISRLTGLLVAAYPLGQMSTSMLWGRVSDTYGRKPAILIGLTISVIANLSFGFSRSIGMLLFWRVLAGMANGILGVMRTMTAEIVKDRKHQTRAFLAPPLIFNSGRVVALAIGGCLADPVDNMPWLFGPSGLLNISRNPGGVAWTLKYPYALPALFNGTVLAVCLFFAALWLRESLPTKANEWDLGIAIGQSITGFVRRKILRRADSGYTAVQLEEGDVIVADVPIAQSSTSGSSTPTSYKARTSRPPFRDIWTRHLLKTLFSFALLPLHNSTFLHIFPVFLSMPTAENTHPTAFRFTGGLGLASPTVGLYLATFGICGILLQLFIYPRIQKHVGIIGAFRFANSLFPLAYVAAPYLSLLSGNRAKWPAMAAVLFSQVMARTMAIPSSVILLTHAAPRRSVLGTVHGAGNTVSAMASATGPVIGGLLLARGIDSGAVGLVWWTWMLLVALVALGWSFVLNRKEYEEGVENGMEDA
ncbi:major facilitator superfamily domain-containing protein [Lophiotrema nucula]|uniref:Major facilitator superfamily domain-containing protein n=1 Tax=Lophiotrema nucula TaxID=690887 RepID=A0A6A5ZJW3_9PLEO|nr:major facilitator superfamily domain-containing protein [Lophiotrema nucula]